MKTTSRRAVMALPAALALAALPAVAVEPNPDAELIRLCNEVIAWSAETIRLQDKVDELNLDNPLPINVRYAEIWSRADHYHHLLGRIDEMAAKTMPGLLAKARACRMHSCDGDNTESMEGWSVARDLLAMGGVV